MMWTREQRACSILTAATVLLLSRGVYAAKQDIERARTFYNLGVQGYVTNEATEALLIIHSLDTLKTTDRRYKVTITPGEGGKGIISQPVKAQCGRNELTVRAGTNVYLVDPPPEVTGIAEQLTVVLTVTASFGGIPCTCQPYKAAHDPGVNGTLMVDGPGGPVTCGATNRQSSATIVYECKGTNLLAGLYKIYANAGADGYHGAPSGVTGRVEATLDGTFLGGRGHGAFDLPPICPLWHVGTIVIHKGQDTGAYLVSEHQEEPGGCTKYLRDLVPEQGRFFEEVDPFKNVPFEADAGKFTTERFGDGPVYLCVGQSQRFKAGGKVNTGNVQWHQEQHDFINVFRVEAKGSNPIPSNTMDGVKGETEGLGVFTGLETGRCQIACNTTNATIWLEKKIEVVVLKMDVVPDFNRDRVIDDQDRDQAIPGNPFRFWINDDKDWNAISGNNLPGINDDPNFVDNRVNGVRDLEDFFPVFLDLKPALDLLNLVDVKVVLKHAAGQLKYFTTDLTAGTAGEYLHKRAVAEPMRNSSVTRITSGGASLPQSFLDKICSGTNKGIILVEAIGREPSTKPLVVEIWKDNKLVCCRSMALSISGVEDMYRHKNLRAEIGPSDCWPNPADSETDPDRLDSPPNMPDSITLNKDFVYVHGVTCDEKISRAGGAAVFKHMFWAGSWARFHRITWRSDEWRLGVRWLGGYPGNAVVDAWYHRNVENAFKTAPHLADYLDGLKNAEKRCVCAHSLGNMVVSAAIEGTNNKVADNYFMISAAVANEAYDPLARDPDSMVHPEWTNYAERVSAKAWHELFPGDGRNELTWGGRFSNSVPAVAMQFYSPDDRVYETRTNVTPTAAELRMIGAFWLWDWLIPVDTTLHRYAWWKQELLKGRMEELPLGGSTYGGWGKNRFYDGSNATQISSTSDEQLREEPVFKTGIGAPYTPTGIEALYAAGSGGGQYAIDHQAGLLAEMIPAISEAAGLSENKKMKKGQFNMPAAAQAGTLGAFSPANISDLYDTVTGSGSKGSNYAHDNHVQLLAEMIPSLSRAAGNTPLFSRVVGNDSLESLRHGWPASRQGAGNWRKDRWLHRDFRDIGYDHVHRLYEKIVEKGDLK